MLLTLFHYTISITHLPYSKEEVERERHYGRVCRRIEKQRAHQIELFRVM
ncbi:hypothetical protein [Alteribacter aurantiacus]|nr:hypothetical protein [Alteribacter aurantiacus]